MFRKVGMICAAAMATVAMTFVPSPAHAANNDGVGDLYEFVQWWEQSFTQSCYDEVSNKTSYAGEIFRSTTWCPGTGAGQNPANNQRSVANYDPDFRVVFWTGANYTGDWYVANRYGVCPVPTDCWYYATLGGWDLDIESHYFAV
ncbi:hypothetical protein [Allorhizocola rhizosphaerae]|uniref:hypothetical protein n=1 Tax=Allorhizocola rhizosphaerae TaxID=1872709 RepID=UPI0013C36518|nr:hypothetical protein [Allorhizocola rhizosphaerae]